MAGFLSTYDLFLPPSIKGLNKTTSFLRVKDSIKLISNNEAILLKKNKNVLGSGLLKTKKKANKKTKHTHTHTHTHTCDEDLLVFLGQKNYSNQITIKNDLYDKQYD